MELHQVWWILTAAVVALELVTGSFYMLMIAAGMFAASIAALVGAALPAQIAVGAVVAAAGVLALRRRQRSKPSRNASCNPDILIDIGQLVHVASWNSDGSGCVQYRGTQWSVSAAESYQGERRAGAHVITGVVGSRLIVRPA